MIRYDAIVVGGGIAGLQAAIQLGRYRHRVLVLDRADGRWSLCRSYKNVLGYPSGVSGTDLREKGLQHLAQLKVEQKQEEVDRIFKLGDQFHVQTKMNQEYICKAVLLATGICDHFPDIENLRVCIGLSIYICPDCDGYEVFDKPVVIIGSGEYGVKMAKELKYFTSELTYVNHDQAPLTAAHQQWLNRQNVHYIDKSVAAIEHRDGRLQSLRLSDGEKLHASHAFLAFGGRRVNSSLAEELGAELHPNRHIRTDPRTKMTTIPGLWAAGDIAVHSEQLTVAMGEGHQAAIWMHKWIEDQHVPYH